MVYKWLYKEPSTISKHHRDWILGPTQHHDIFPSTSHGYRGLILCRIRAPLQVIQVFGFLTKHRVGIRSSSQGWLKMRNVVIIQLIQLVQLMYVYIYIYIRYMPMIPYVGSLYFEELQSCEIHSNPMKITLLPHWCASSIRIHGFHWKYRTSFHSQPSHHVLFVSLLEGTIRIIFRQTQL